MTTRRIALIAESLDRAGTPKQLTLLAAALPRDAFDVRVLALERGGPHESTLSAAGIPVTIIGQRGWADPIGYGRLLRTLKRLRPDVVHTWGETANFCCRSTALAAGVKTLIASEQGIDPHISGPRWMIDRWLARRTSRIVAVSPHVRDFYVAGGLPAEKFAVIPNGVPLVSGEIAAASTQGGPNRSALLAELGLPPGARLIVSLGALKQHKRLKDLIWATELLRNIRDDFHLLIVGDGPQREALKRYRDLVQIRDRVHFLGPRDDAAAILTQCDLLWLSSAYEGLSNSVMEALAAGIPVVASDIPGVRELVTNGEHGILVPVGDRAAFARYANKLVNDADLRSKLGAAGRERMQREFSVGSMVNHYAALYRDVLQ